MTNHQRDIEQWMKDFANKRSPKSKLVFDKNTKKLISVPLDDPRIDADEAIDFIPEDAVRFGWPDPNDIVQLLTIAVSAVGGSKAIIELIKLWFDERKNRKIKIRKGDCEIEIQGSMSLKEVERRVEQFKKLTRDIDDDEINIIQ